jgi:hypothetical protein
MMSTSPLDCQIIGDADLYGLGVRLTIYVQAMTYLCFVSFAHTPRMILEIPCLMTSLAVSSVLLLKAAQHSLRPFDTMLALFTIGTLSGVAPLGETAVVNERGKSIGGKIINWTRVCCEHVQLGLGMWAVWNDMRVDLKDMKDCPVWIYVFSKQRNRGWALGVWKGFYMLFAVLLAIRLVAWNVGIMKACARVLWRKGAITKASAVPETDTLSESTRVTSKEAFANPQAVVTKPKDIHASSWPQQPGKPHMLRRVSPKPRRPETWVLAIAFFWLTMFNILGGELMIYWNDVQGINSRGSSGQVITLLAGTFTIAQFIWKISGLSSK